MYPPTHVHTYHTFTCKHAHIAPHVCMSRLTHRCDWRLRAGVLLPWPRWTCWVGGSGRPMVTAWTPAMGGTLSAELCRGSSVPRAPPSLWFLLLGTGIPQALTVGPLW